MKKITFSFIAFAITLFNHAQQVIFSDDFEAETVEATTFTNWTAVDVDNDGEFFEVSSVIGTDVEASPLVGLVADSDSWESGNANSPMNPNNYLITSSTIDLTGATDGVLNFTFGTFQSNGTFLEDRLAVYLSTSNDPAVISTETPIYDSQIGQATPADNGGANSAVDISLDISAFEGQQVYLVFRHYNTFDHNSVLIDNVEVSSMALSINEFALTKIKHSFDQFTKTLTIESQAGLSHIYIYNVLGQESINTKLTNTISEISLSELQAGIYIAKIFDKNNASKTIKLIVK
jgi:hypothetical protein